MNREKIVENTGFEIEIQSEIKRKIKILQLISIEKRWYTFEEISTVTGISSKTISKDLVFIRELVPVNWDIKIKKGYGVQLIMPLDTSIKEVVSLFFRKSLTFQLLNKLLFHKEMTVLDMAEDLYIQPYKVTQILKKIEKDLSHYGLKLKRKPLKIIGDDWEIIYMFTDLYSKAYRSSEWPFQYNQEYIFNFIKELEDAMGILLSLSSRRKFAFFIVILLLRKQHGHQIELIHDFLYLNIDTPAYNKISKITRNSNKHFGVSFSTIEKIILTTALKTLNYEYKYPNQEKDSDFEHFNKSKIPVYCLVRDFIEMLDDKLGYDFINDEEFVHWLIEYFREKFYILHTLSNLKRIEDPSIQYMKRKHLKTFLQVKDVYNRWVKKHNVARYVIDEEIVKIVIYIEAKQIYKNLNPKKAIIITNENRCWKNYIEAVLKSKFGNKLEFPSIISTNIARGYELETEHEIDLVISTISLDLDLNPVIKIQPVVTERDLSNIEYFINSSM